MIPLPKVLTIAPTILPTNAAMMGLSIYLPAPRSEIEMSQPSKCQTGPISLASLAGLAEVRRPRQLIINAQSL